eukprot:2468273-Amphidinium_carterae.1
MFKDHLQPLSLLSLSTSRYTLAWKTKTTSWTTIKWRCIAKSIQKRFVRIIQFYTSATPPANF